MKYYELVGTVVNVKEEKGNGNIVSHMKVSEVYHQRKEKVTCTQWYLFNDLVIEPIEKVRLFLAALKSIKIVILYTAVLALIKRLDFLSIL